MIKAMLKLFKKYKSFPARNKITIFFEYLFDVLQYFYRKDVQKLFDSGL